MTNLSRGRLVVVAIALSLIIASCSSTPAALPATPTGSAVASSSTPTRTAAAIVPGGSGVPVPGLPAPGSTSADPSTTVVPVVPAVAAVPTPTVGIHPADGARGISPTAPVTVTARNGTLSRVALLNPEGKSVKGKLSADRRVWTSSEPLGYGRRYTVEAGATAPGVPTAVSTTAFSTLSPAQTIYPSFFPNPAMKTVGVGQPMVVIFDSAPADKAAAERALTVETVPSVAGSWFWWDDRTVHYRAQTYWAPGTRITVSANLYGVDLGGGSYGETDRSMTVTIGQSKIATIDDATKQMRIFVDGKNVKTFPVSMGMNKTVTVGGKEISFVTPSGTYVGQEKYAVKQMSSASYGLPVASSLGYDSSIPLAVRFSNEGIFVHAAPWSVADQGVRNVSHGCINLGPAAGRWFYDNFGYGDILTVKGTSTKLAPTDGYGDWNIGWQQWRAGSALV